MKWKLTRRWTFAILIAALTAFGLVLPAAISGLAIGIIGVVLAGVVGIAAIVALVYPRRH